VLHFQSADEILDAPKLSGHCTGIALHELTVQRADQIDVERAASGCKANLCIEEA
jgi:hypothetical protein